MDHTGAARQAHRHGPSPQAISGRQVTNARIAADPDTHGLLLCESLQQVQQRFYPCGQHQIHGAFDADTDHCATR